MRINKVLKALSHPIRRDIVAALREGSASAGDLAARYDVSKPTMSTHFASLKSADLIYGEKEGVSIIYHLNVTVADESLGALMGLLGAGGRMGDDGKELSEKEASEKGASEQ